jgi:hypothetical protein
MFRSLTHVVVLFVLRVFCSVLTLAFKDYGTGVDPSLKLICTNKLLGLLCTRRYTFNLA